jgi:uncharacterized membrane protein YfcA
VRIKLVIVALGAGVAALIASFTGISPQAAFAPMLGWMLGFSASKSQATAMRVTAGTAIACAAGALWYSSVSVVIKPSTEARLSQIKVAHLDPAFFALNVVMLFIGATVGAVLAAKLAPKPNMIALRRIFLFTGVCIGVYVAAEGAHFNVAAGDRIPLVHGAGAMLFLGVVSGSLTQVLGLASGVILVPSLFYFAGLPMQQAVLVSITVIALAALLPAWSYNRRGLADMQYSGAGMIGGMLCGFVGGALLVGTSTRLLLILFAIMAMFFSAREISMVVLDESMPKSPPGPGLT